MMRSGRVGLDGGGGGQAPGGPRKSSALLRTFQEKIVWISLHRKMERE